MCTTIFAVMLKIALCRTRLLCGEHESCFIQTEFFCLRAFVRNGIYMALLPVPRVCVISAASFQVRMQEPLVFANSPIFTLGFEIVYITEAFTHYQMAWHYGWILVTLMFMFLPKIGFFYEMLQLHQNFWSRQQVGRCIQSGQTIRSSIRLF